MIDLNKYQTIFFDCDGVILNSNQAKTDAFREVLKDYPSNAVDRFINYHQMNMGISRYGKFNHFFNKIYPVENSIQFIDQSVKYFSEITREKLLDCSIISGVKDLLLYFLEKKVECFLVTGGDQEEVRFIFKKRKLEIYFKGIFGSPTDKYRNLEIIKRDYQVGNSLYFGDSKIDLDVAEEFSLDFIYVSGVSEWVNGKEYCKDNGYSQIEDFTQIFRN